MKFDWFVIPFLSGLTFVTSYCVVRFFNWIRRLSRGEKALLQQHLFSRSIWQSVKEIFFESLLHRKIFKTHPLLGYMHASLAFGWFLLIVLGNIEIKFYSEYSVNPPYVPIFLNYFESMAAPHFFGRGFKFLMDLLLLIILSGVALAFFKRIIPSNFGMKRTMQHHLLDRLAMISLWCIFPFRLLAESFSAAIYHNGSFLTNSLGKWLSALPVDKLIYPAWWGYSIVLGIFFFTLPFSRYMHIPTEVLLILFRKAGIRSQYHGHPYQQVEIQACSRCGICIDTCQLASLDYTVQPSYYIRSLRYGETHKEYIQNCLLCGRCVESCPVGVSSTNIRLHERTLGHEMGTVRYTFAPPIMSEDKVEVLYFAGCMTHLVPGIKKAMSTILNHSGYTWHMLDADQSVCCGRPLLLAGQIAAANQVIMDTRSRILNYHPQTLVTSCPICYKVFKENYRLNVQVLHHTQFIEMLLQENKILTNRLPISVKYHDPCELGRGMQVYDEPRKIINSIAHLLSSVQEKSMALCCGGSLANTWLNIEEKQKITHEALDRMNITEANYLITACPLCQKTFGAISPVPVKDISEFVIMGMQEKYLPKSLIKAEVVQLTSNEHVAN